MYREGSEPTKRNLRFWPTALTVAPRDASQWWLIFVHTYLATFFRQYLFRFAPSCVQQNVVKYRNRIIFIE